MTAVHHPYEDLKEVDIAYFDKYLVISHFHNIRFVQLTADEIKTTIRQF